MSKLDFGTAKYYFEEKGFYAVKHPVAIHHALKDFADYDVTRHAFYILPAGEDFVHVAVIEYDVGRLISWEPYVEHPESRFLQIRYSCAGDDLLYGLRVKYNSGGSEDPFVDIGAIEIIISDIINTDLEPKSVYAQVIQHPRYIRKRFRHGRKKAKLRAFLIMLRDMWRAFRS